MCGRICMCAGAYFIVSNVARAHVVTVLTAVARVGDKRARIGMMTIFSCRVNSTVTSERGSLRAYVPSIFNAELTFGRGAANT